MAVLSANDFASQIIAQARILDPSFSGEVGTPERKLIDATAQSLAETQVDLTGLSGALDIDSKYGSNLDRFTALFSFQRQQASSATGYVNFTRNTPAPNDITIPANTILQATTSNIQGQFPQFTTTATATIASGSSDSGAVPIVCATTGTFGNVAANTITQMVGAIVGGVTAVTNANPLTNGADQESDNALKVRFKNTWARNLAGTSDQYLALAVAGAFTTKANVIGAQSRFQEYVQVPGYDDAGYVNGSFFQAEDTTGNLAYQNQYTSAVSSVPYIKQVYTSTPVFIQNNDQNLFYRPDTDFTFNSTPVLFGDALRSQPNTLVPSGVTIGPGNNITVLSTAGFPSAGSLWVRVPSIGFSIVNYTGVTSTSFTGCTYASGASAGSMSGTLPVYLYIAGVVQPNFTFINVAQAADVAANPTLQSLTPGQIVLSEFSYVSSASRNDISHAITNAVDIYVNGTNDVQGSCSFLPNNLKSFNLLASSPWYYENYRRDGNSSKRPQAGNYITPLFNSPVDALPATISINNQNYYLGTHYWLVRERGDLAGSIRARDGIEWNANLGGDTNGVVPPVDPTAPYLTNGATISSLGPNVAVNVDNYLYDSNIVTLQASIEANKQITTDPLVHQSKNRYFKLDVTVMYSPNSSPTSINASIGAAIQVFFDNQSFGAVIQLSDLLDAIHQVPGVDNVRWSNDLPIAPNSIRVVETDALGNPLHGVMVDRGPVGSTTTAEVQYVNVVGGIPSSSYIVTVPDYAAFGANDTFTLTWTDPWFLTHTTAAVNTVTTGPILFSSLAVNDGGGTLQTRIRNAMTAAGVTGTGLYGTINLGYQLRSQVNVVNPILTYTITYGTGAVYLPTVTTSITQSSFSYDSDFFLLDNELPALPAALPTDTVPGLIIRTRAQNTWLRSGLG